MKISTVFRICVLSMVLVVAGPSNAQNSTKPGQETLHLFSDRNMYVIGEVIHFSAVRNDEQDSAGRVLYVEMITPDGSRITGGKYSINKGLSHGCLEIPEDLLSGYYYIRAYTRAMRNFGPLAYDYVPLTIINPYKSNILASGNGSSRLYATDSMLKGPFRFTNARSHYRSREKVELTIEKNNENQVIRGVSITIVPKNSVNDYRVRMPYDEKVPDSSIVYYAETRGISLTGKLMDREQMAPVAGQIVTLSVLGDKDFSGYKTDRNGRFFFTLPDDTGKRDIFLSSADYNSAGSSLFIDNDFCSVPIILPSSEFKLTADQKTIALRLAANARINKDFTSSGLLRADTVAGEKKPFYGEPTQTLFMDKFIQLPSLQEYFDEISLEVRVRERKGRKYFKFVSEEAGMMVNDPLILVDWVAINDMEKVLSLSPQKILKIETVNKPYVKGNLTYGGIISIISRDGDFAGIDLPASGIFVKYDFYAPACTMANPIPDAGNIPDARNTLLWVPEFQYVNKDKSRISFDTPDSPGRYEIWIRGVYTDGSVFGQSVTFGVTAK